MRLGAFWLLAVLLLACGKVERQPKEARKPADAAAEAEPAAPPALVPPPRMEESPCPECGGLGRCIRCGDERPCTLCAGRGACALCGGDGRTRDGDCPACDGGGRCADCAGAGVLKRRTGKPARVLLPGICPTCRFGTGLCPDCGGAGVLVDGRSCVLCDGAKTCPECRGTGEDVWCNGTGLCPTCEGHGQIIDGRPGTSWPPFRLLLRSGAVLVGRLLEPPGATVSIEHTRGGKVVREAIVASNVHPLDLILAMRRFADPDRAEDQEAIAKAAVAKGDDYLFLARQALLAAKRIAPRTSRVLPLLLQVQLGRSRRIDREGDLALAQKDPAQAFVLFTLALNAGASEADRKEIAAHVSEARSLIEAEDAGLSDQLRERRREAEQARIDRAVRRSEDWRQKALAVLAVKIPDHASLETARRSAREAWISVLRAADRAPDGVDLAAARAEGARSRSVVVRLTVAQAINLLEAGLIDRARAVGSIAMGLDPDDEGARSFTSTVEAELARRALEAEEDR